MPTVITKKGLSSLGNIKDPDVRRVLMTLVECIQMLQGAQGKIRDRALRVSDLVDLGILGIHNNDTLFDPSKPIIDEFNDHSRAAVGFTGIFAAIQSNTGNTVHILVDNGQVVGFSGGFEALQTSTMTTETIIVASGLLTPTSGVYDVLDPHTNTTLTMTVTGGRIMTLV